MTTQKLALLALTIGSVVAWAFANKHVMGKLPPWLASAKLKVAATYGPYMSIVIQFIVSFYDENIRVHLPIIFPLIGLVCLDTYLGWSNAARKGKASSRKFAAVARKVSDSVAFLVAVFLVTKVSPWLFFLNSMAVSVIAFRELLSILEKLRDRGFAIPAWFAKRLEEAAETQDPKTKQQDPLT